VSRDKFPFGVLMRTREDFVLCENVEQKCSTPPRSNGDTKPPPNQCALPMNTDTMLNNSGSSFDTVPSYDFILRREDRDEEEEFDEEEEAPEVFHLIDSVPEVGAGVLIVPPTSDSEDSRNTVLSVPDTVPSVLTNSILPPLPNSVHIVEEVEERESSGATDEPGISTTTDQSSKKEVITTNSSLPRRILIALLVFVVVAALSISEALYLRHETWLLKEQVRLLQEEAALSAAKLTAIKEDQAKEMVLDTCWLQANAKMTLGECAQDATATVRTHVQTMQEYAEQAWNQVKQTKTGMQEYAEHAWKQVKQTYEDSIKDHVETIERVVQTAPTSIAEYARVEYKSWKDWIQEELSIFSKVHFEGPSHSRSADSTDNTNGSPETYKEKKSSSLQAVSKSVLVTAVWSTAAALLVSSLDFYWKQQSIKG
jgi:hypothetical protein